MPKFFVKTNQIEENKIKIIGEDVKHINQVLRAKIGEELTICNLDTTLNYITTISQITPEYVMCDIQDCVKSFVESNVQVTIFQGLPKADKMEYIIQKNTELGAKQIVPVEMVRCVVKLDSKKEGKKIERWQKIAESAAKQSGRDLIPTVEMSIDINNLCEKIKEFDAVILAYEEEKEKNDLKVISEKLEVINEQLAMKQKQKRKMLVNTLIVADVCLIILFILLAIFGSPYQSWDYSDPEWSVIGTLWHSFEWVYFKVAPLMVIVITAILGIIFVKRKK